MSVLVLVLLLVVVPSCFLACCKVSANDVLSELLVNVLLIGGGTGSARPGAVRAMRHSPGRGGRVSDVMLGIVWFICTGCSHCPPDPRGSRLVYRDLLHHDRREHHLRASPVPGSARSCKKRTRKRREVHLEDCLRSSPSLSGLRWQPRSPRSWNRRRLPALP